MHRIGKSTDKAVLKSKANINVPFTAGDAWLHPSTSEYCTCACLAYNNVHGR